MIRLDLERDEFAEALYLAHLSAGQIALENPHDAPTTLIWGDVPEAVRAIWRATAERLLAFYGVK